MHPQPGHTSSLLEIDILVIRIFFNKAVIIINRIFESNYKEYKAKSQSITDFKVFLNDKKMKMIIILKNKYAILNYNSET